MGLLREVGSLREVGIRAFVKHVVKARADRGWGEGRMASHTQPSHIPSSVSFFHAEEVMVFLSCSDDTMGLCIIL